MSMSQVPPLPPLPKKWMVSIHTHLWTIVGIIVVAALVCIHISDAGAAHANAIAAAYEQKLADQKASVASLTQQLAAQKTALTQQLAALSATNASLESQVSKENASLKVALKTDASLSAQAAAAKLSQQVQVPPAQVTPSGNGVVVSLPAARDMAADLDKLAALEVQVPLLTKENAQADVVIHTQQGELATSADIISGLNIELSTQKNACDAKISALKKSRMGAILKAFGVGVVVGLVFHVL